MGASSISVCTRFVLLHSGFAFLCLTFALFAFFMFCVDFSSAWRCLKGLGRQKLQTILASLHVFNLVLSQNISAFPAQLGAGPADRHGLGKQENAQPEWPICKARLITTNKNYNKQE